MIDSIDDAGPSAPAVDGAAIEAFIERIVRWVTDISLGVERWDDPYARGLGLYFVVARNSMPDCAAPMGANRWRVESCGTVFADLEVFLAAA
jgi:hypothetical protein